MTVSSLDVYRTAHVIVEKYGDMAPAFVEQRRQNFLEAGDKDAVIVWAQIADAVTWLQLPGVPTDETLQ